MDRDRAVLGKQVSVRTTRPKLFPPIRDVMVREGREEELDGLVAEARARHDSLRRGGGG